ncbi:hypothetical protein [Phaffia rhodozyma]|uniref:Mitochondrial zinc maintenance protein 1, mitochondrial n=1 Tax=Phaffia rhodozyma TaxID=264483 RepID=A0A0F7SJB7_PHARH|nr:hypothetical protein [Phaffia rhodozyma]
MSVITPQLQQTARSAYRHVLRSARQVFAGDNHALSTAHAKLRQEYTQHRLETDLAKYQERITMTREVGDLLRKHVVQGEDAGDGTFNLRISDEQLADNDSIRKAKLSKESVERAKTAGPFPNRRRRAAASSTPADASS